jgi:hypothetical protein
MASSCEWRWFSIKDGSRQVGSVDLGVALRAIRVQRLSHRRVAVNIKLSARSCGTIGQGNTVAWVPGPAVPGMAAQAEEPDRLPEQVVGHRAVRLMANTTVLRDGRMRVGKRPLLLHVALVAELVDVQTLGLQVGVLLPVRVVAVRADHLAFLDRVMRRQGVHGVDLRMALVAGFRFLDRHLQTLLVRHAVVADAHKLLHAGVRMRVVAIGARHIHQVVRRGVPSHDRRMLAVAGKAQIPAGFFQDLAMGIMAGGAVEAVGSADLMRPRDAGKLRHIAMALEADVRRLGAHKDGRTLQGRLRRSRLLITRQGDLAGTTGYYGFRRRRSAGRDVVVTLVAVRAGDVMVGVRRGAPVGTGGAHVLFVAAGTGFRALHRRGCRLEAEDQPRRLATRRDVLASRAMAGLAGLTFFAQATMEVLFERLRVSRVAGGADFVVVDELGVGDDRQVGPQHRVGHRAKRASGASVIRFRHARIRTEVGVCSPPFSIGITASGHSQTKCSQQQHAGNRWERNSEAMLVVHDVASVLKRDRTLGRRGTGRSLAETNYVQPRGVPENDEADGGQRLVNVRAIRWLAAGVDAPLSKTGCCQIPKNGCGRLMR